MKLPLHLGRILYLFLLLFSMTALQVSAQSITNYTFAASSGTFTALSGGTAPALTSGSTDEGWYNAIPLGFTFNYMGTAYTTMSACTNGWMTLGGNISDAAYANALSTGGKRPVIAPLWDDLDVGTFSYLTQGTAGNRTFTAEWNSCLWDYSATAAGVSFQVVLYEATGQVKFIYHPEAGALVSPSASIGITATGTATGNFLSLDGVGTSPLASSTTETTTLASSPADGQVYAFTPNSTPASDPISLTFSAVGVLGMTVNWVDNSTSESFFRIVRATDAGFTANVTTTTVASTSVATTGTAYNLPITGLLPGTRYYFKIIAGNEGLPVSAGLTGNQITNAAGNVASNGTGGGNWSAAATWAGGVVPTATDNVVIKNGDVVTIDAAASAVNVTVGEGSASTLQFNTTTAVTLTVGVDVTVSANASLTTGATGTVTTHVLSVGRNITNNGTLDFSTNTNTAGAGITFTGTLDGTFSGTGATTDVYLITMSKSSSSVTVELNLSNFTVKGLNTSALYFLTSNIGTGIIKISGTNTFNGNVWSAASYTIPATLGFWLNNPNFTVNAQTGSTTVLGMFRISAGTFNVGTASNSAFAFSAGSVITVEGGAVNTAGRFAVGAVSNAITYTQTGGTITVCKVGNTSNTLASFDMGNGSNATISGGTIIVQLANTGTTTTAPKDFRNQAATANVTGGTLQLGNASSGTAKTFTIDGVLPNIVLTNTSANHSAKICALNTTTTGSGDNYYSNSLDINIATGTTLNLTNGITATYSDEFIFGGTTITNNGTLTYTSTIGNLIISSNGDVNYTGTGTVTAPMTGLSVEIGGKFTVDPASPNIVTARFNLFDGDVINANKITVGNGGATSATIQVGHTTTPGYHCTADKPLTFNLGTGGEVLYALRSSVPIDMTNFINSTRVFTALDIDPDAGNTVTLAGGDIQVTSTILLTSGFWNLGGSIVTLGTSTPTAVTMTGSATTVYNGKLKEWLTAATGTYIFPIGTSVLVPAANYTLADNTSNRIKAVDIASIKNHFSANISNDLLTSKKNSSILIETPVNLNTSVAFTTAPTTAGTLTAEWVGTPGGTNGLPLTEGAISVDRTTTNGFWRLTAADGLTGGVYTGAFAGTSITSITDFTGLVLVNRTGASSPWTLNGTHVTTTGTNSAPVLSRTGMVGFGEYAVGGNSAVNPLPVELTSFTSSVIGRNVVLNWKTKTEVNLNKFVIERSVSNKADWNVIGEVRGTGNSNSEKAYSFSDKRMTSGKFEYRLRIVDIDGSNSVYKNIVEASIDIPKEYSLNQNYPNPFNPSTKIEYSLPYDSHVTLELYSVTGERIAQVVNEMQKAGYYSKEVNLTKLNLASGIYLYRISAIGSGQNANFVSVKKMVMLK